MNTSQQEKLTMEEGARLYNWKQIVEIRFDGNSQVTFPLLCAHCHFDMQKAQESNGKDPDFVCNKCGNAISQKEIDKIMMTFPKMS